MDYFLLCISTIGTVYSVVKIIADIVHGKKWTQIRTSHEFVIFIFAILLAFFLLFPWRKVHYGEIKPMVVHDTIRENVFKTDTVYVHDKAINKKFENKINKVETLNQN